MNILISSNNYNGKNGYVLFDKEYNTYLDKILSIIKKTKNCILTHNTKRFELYYCESQ